MIDEDRELFGSFVDFLPQILLAIRQSTGQTRIKIYNFIYLKSPVYFLYVMFVIFVQTLDILTQNWHDLYEQAVGWWGKRSRNLRFVVPIPKIKKHNFNKEGRACVPRMWQCWHVGDMWAKNFC